MKHHLWRKIVGRERESPETMEGINNPRQGRRMDKDEVEEVHTFQRMVKGEQKETSQEDLVQIFQRVVREEQEETD